MSVHPGGEGMPGSLEAIWIKRFKRGPMDGATEARLVEDRGIVGNANQGGRRQVTVIQRDTWDDMMRDLGDPGLDPSVRRANLLVDGVDLADSRGKVLEVGAVRIRIVGETRPCERMDEAFPGLRHAMSRPWRGGAYGTVLRGGTIRVGDAARLVDELPE